MIKTALITGGATRIGAATAQHLHEAGYNVIIHYRSSKDAAMALCDSLNTRSKNSASLVHGNLHKTDEIEALADSAMRAFGTVDILVNNASSFYATPFQSVTQNQWDELFNSNVRGAYFLSQALLPSLGANDGCIINVLDIHADKPLPEHSLYGMAKAAAQMMTKSLAQELAPQVRVNGIAPGAILWPAEQGLLSDTKEQQEILNRTPLGRIGEPSDIAKAVLFLVRDAPFVTGQIINIDGGRTTSV